MQNLKKCILVKDRQIALSKNVEGCLLLQIEGYYFLLLSLLCNNIFSPLTNTGLVKSVVTQQMGSWGTQKELVRIRWRVQFYWHFEKVEGNVFGVASSLPLIFMALY